MKIKNKIITAAGILMIVIMALFAACKEEVTGPPTVPIKAEIKQVIIDNSLFNTEFLDLDDTDGIDTVVVTVPQGTDITKLEMDIIFSYFGKLEPEVSPTTDLSSPKTFTVTANLDSDYEESRQYIIMGKLVPPSLSSFYLTPPLDKAAKITGDSIVLSLLEGQDYSSVSFMAEYFGESIEPSMDQTLDLLVDTTITVLNKEFKNDYKIIIDWYKIIEFTGFIYDGTKHPNVDYPGAISSEDSAFITINESEGAVLGGKAARFTSLEPGTGSVYWVFSELGLDAEPDEITLIMRGRGYKTKEADHRYVEIVFYLGARRFQFWVTLDKGLDGTGWGDLQYEDIISQKLDPLEWNTYRMTANKVTGEVLLYLNENPDPLPEFMPLSMDDGRTPLQWKAGFGDGSGGNTYDGEYDYFIIETGGAYSPEDLPLSKILPQ